MTDSPSTWRDSTTMNDLIALTRFIKKRWWIFLIVMVLFGWGLYHFYQKRTYYSSRITFLVNTSNTAELVWNRDNDNVDFRSDDKGFERVSQIIYSSRMLEFLIDSFDLYKHYGISKKSEDGYLHVTQMLKGSLNVSISKTKIITVQASDRNDPKIAAHIANAIGKKINDINRQITIESMSRKVEMFEVLSKDLKENSQLEIRKIDSMFVSMQRFIEKSVRDASYAQILNMDIQALRQKSDEYFKTLFDSYKYKLYNLYSLQEKNLPTITVLEEALPNKPSKNKNNKYVYPLIVFASFLFAPVSFYFYMKSAVVVRYIFGEAFSSRREPVEEEEESNVFPG